ncbi:hypothetical protein LSG31_09100 [Fodinisporobacter ferrooxydans]|uniref:Uncharacterized protein n=1 Tax=Fodinisporobacter ferrooxydans TaxID=2901836 RepID=A0ABY4CSU0_9BACL|nr:hypothetical protein LSG31_09100 [Alicyclobacillaceae bacterium MYW30-H2]
MAVAEGIQSIARFNYYNYNNFNKHTDLFTVLTSNTPEKQLPSSDTTLTKPNLKISFQTYTPRLVQHTYQLSMDKNQNMNQAYANGTQTASIQQVGLNPSVSKLLGNSIDVYA